MASMRVLRNLAMQVARSPLGGFLAWLAVGPLGSLAPVGVVARRELVSVLRHPRPSYPIHLLIVPRRRILDYFGVTPRLLAGVIDAATEVRDQVLGGAAVELVSNLGTNQEVRLLHFHLIPESHEAPVSRMTGLDAIVTASTAAARTALERDGGCRVVVKLPTEQTPVQVLVL